MTHEATLPVVEASRTPIRPFREFWGYFSANKGAVAGLVVMAVNLLVDVTYGVINPRIRRS